MTRIGQNPAKLGVRSYPPQPLGIATIVYIPSLEGYFRDSAKILELALNSLIKNTPESFDLLVFDNGSCREVKDRLVRLQQDKVIRWLVLSGGNLGKTGAQNWIFGSMPNEWICYTDSDVLFRDGWLEASRDIIKHFPDAGMVGAQPCFFDVLKGKGQAHLSILSKTGYSLETYNPMKEDVDEYCRGINASGELSAKYHVNPLNRIRVRKDGFSASLGASHMQFMIPRDMARKIIPLPGRSGLSQEEDRELDLKVDRAGGLHLSTEKAYVVHIGNVLDEWAQEMIVKAGVSMELDWPTGFHELRTESIPTKMLSKLAGWRWSRVWLTRLYNKLFQVLSEHK